MLVVVAKVISLLVQVLLNPIEGTLWFNSLDKTIYVYNKGAWVPSATAVAGVSSVSGAAPIFTTGTPQNPTVGIRQANTTEVGAARFANQAEVDSIAADDIILTPSRLHQGIDFYLPQAT